MNSQTLIHRYLLGEASEAETAELNHRLADDAELRRQFGMAAAMDAGLRDVAMQRAVGPTDTSSTNSNTSQRVGQTTDRLGHNRNGGAWKYLLAMAASALLVLMLWPRGMNVQPVASNSAEKKSVAKLLTSENAAWESSLPTLAGSVLSQGEMKLLSGIATIQFDSGAEVMLEAPAQLQLISPMRARLITGAAVVNVPEPAIGFTLDTPDGYVVDHGTKFAVNLQADLDNAEIEVIEGQISVHHTPTSKDIRLTDGEAVTMSADRLTPVEEPQTEKSIRQSPKVVHVRSDRATTVIRNDRRDKWVHPDFLMVKHSAKEGKFDRRIVFSFDISQVDLDAVANATLKLNQVPSGIGFANLLPESNRFVVYGMTNAAKDNWSVDANWNDAPSADDGVLLGTFDIPRSRQTGVHGIRGEELLSFIKANQHRPITLVVLRQTAMLAGSGKSLVHAFASESHPEAAGPVLKFSAKPTQ